MRKETVSDRIFKGFVSIVTVVLLFTSGVYAEGSVLSDSLKDDVTAMITNAKKMPHQIFIVDSSESMNSFAYSDVYDTCDDGESNLQKGIDLCDNAYRQCRNVEKNAMCDVDLNCGDIDAKCTNLKKTKTDLSNLCREIKQQKYPEPDMFATVDVNTNKWAKTYVGPWDPSRTYDQDLCFYDWTADNNADVITADENPDSYHGTADSYNNKKLCEKYGISSSNCDEWIKGKYGNITERSDWDCLTDGSNHILPGNTSLTWQQVKNTYGGVSGLWLNWKYATSLDALKIILADTHQFSYPPRARGDNSCYKTNYIARQKYQEVLICTDEDVTNNVSGCSEAGRPVLDGSGQPVYVDKTACFVAFDPSLTGASNRETQLVSLKDAVESMWESVPKADPDPSEALGGDDLKAVKLDSCRDFRISNESEPKFSIYDSSSYPVEDNTDGCDKCMRWSADSSGNGSFIETECTSYQGSKQGDGIHEQLGSNIQISLYKTCCKTFSCENPKCRDNDLCCKDNDAAFPNNSVEGYDTCHDYSCALGFYSEFDQDTNHCCNELVCSEEGEKSTYTSSGETCDKCDTGAAMGTDTGESTTGVDIVLPTPSVSGQAYCGPGSTEEECKDIPVTVGIKDTDAAAIPFGDIESIKITVYFDCADSTSEHPANLLGEGTCISASDCVSVVTGELKGCSETGYRMEAQVVVTRRNCHFDKKDLDFEIDYSFGTDGYMIGTFKDKNILDKNTAFYHTYNLETQASADKVIEYECKTSFYTRQFITRSGSSCPSPNEAPSYINQINQGEKVEFCEARTAEREVIARDQWGTATAVACSWLCRSAVTYDEPWKCASFFYMMDDVDRNGPAVCNNKCYNATSDNHKLAECCKCINGTQGQYLHHETPGKVSMVDPDNNSYQQYTCSVSGYQYAKASNGGTTTASGYQAEIINGHINEGGSAGYYMLSPYGWDSGNQHFWTPYTSFADANDPGTGGWYSKYSLINSENGQKYLGDAQTSLFTTGDAEVRKPVCVYDLLWNWTGSDCSTANCSSSCCSIDLSQDSNNCDYPSFWMKMPDGHGGKILMENLEIMSQDSYKTIFRNRIKGLKASGPSTLGETLYDVWRYLGGMYSLHDPGLVSNGETVISSKPYKSPFSTTDGGPMCFTNEAVIISGGNPQFDANYELKDYGVSCPDFDPDFSTPSDTVKPCVKDSPKVSISQHSPYIEGNEWERTSLLNVAKFVNKNTFWAKEECRNAGMTMSNDNAGGIKADCLDSSMTGANKPVIDRVHAIAVGEWGLSALYHSLSNTGNKYLNESLIKQVAESTEKDGEKGRYYTLTTTNSNGTSGGGSFDNLTDLFASFVNNARPTDVVVGRPHWTSSLVQPFDVEEKYRGPEAYVAGAVPVDGTVSRFWFGNLKKYEIRKEQEGSCPIYDDSEADCGEWKKQTFDANDCFASDDNGTGFSGADSYSVTQFEKLMVGGAAFRLAKKLGTSCSGLPCYQQNSSPRKLYTDMNGEMTPLKDVDGDDLESKFRRFDNSFTGDKIEQIFDYMAGYDSFNPTLADRKKVRYSGGETFKVDNPFDVDFNHSESKKLTLRPLLLGAIIHSKPVAVYYEDNSNTRIYAGANDGMLHAFDSTGDEVYAYIPSLAYKSISNFANTNSSIFFNATVDGPITMFHIDQSHDGIINSGEKAFLIFGYRRGAKGYTVIDISDPDAPKFVQNLNDENSGHEGGLSFGKAVIFRKCSGSCSYANDLDYYLAVPGGYDTCHDPTALTNVISNNTPLCSQNELLGNKFTIYKFDKDNNRFDTANSIEFSPTSSRLGDFEKSWLVTSFTSNPFVINTSGKAAVNTEFVYFTDLSGTVFRVDVRSNTPSDWTAKVVYTGRNGGSGNTIKNIDWKSINRSYVATNFFPPLERYNPSKDENGLIPIPVITGNAANPKFKKQEGIHVFYDSKDGNNDPLYTTNFLINSSGDSHSPTNGMIENKRGWQVDFGKTSGEKGITEPLIVYDIYGTKDSATSHSYTIAWNTYTPMEATACKTFGTSSNYERFINDGAQAFKNLAMTSTNGEWNIAGSDGSCVKADNLSLATGVGIVATDNGYDLTFGAGADIFRKEHLTVKMNATYMIKWYELY